MSQLTFITALSPDECIQSLKKHTDLWPLFHPPAAGKPVIAEIWDTRFRLSATLPPGFLGHIGPGFCGRLEPSAGGTLIAGAFRKSLLMRIGMGVSLAVALALNLVVWVAALLGKLGEDVSLMQALGCPMAMLLFVIGFLAFVLWIEQGQCRRIEDFIANELRAQRQ